MPALSLAQITTLAPSAASASAKAAPKPLLAPVITTTLPLSLTGATNGTLLHQLNLEGIIIVATLIPSLRGYGEKNRIFKRLVSVGNQGRVNRKRIKNFRLLKLLSRQEAIRMKLHSKIKKHLQIGALTHVTCYHKKPASPWLSCAPEAFKFFVVKVVHYWLLHLG